MTRRSLVETPRLIKWVGDTKLVKQDGYSTPNWRYENNRVTAVPRFSNRVLRKGDGADLDANKQPIPGTGLSKDYVWEKRNLGYVIEVEFRDAMIILRNDQMHEFKDVTDVAHPETVTYDVRVVASKKGAPHGSRA